MQLTNEPIRQPPWQLVVFCSASSSAPAPSPGRPSSAASATRRPPPWVGVAPCDDDRVKDRIKGGIPIPRPALFANLAASHNPVLQTYSQRLRPRAKA
jgi:hypothetical protein